MPIGGHSQSISWLQTMTLVEIMQHEAIFYHVVRFNIVQHKSTIFGTIREVWTSELVNI